MPGTTLPQFFTEASGGRFTVTGQVTDWVESTLTLADWLGFVRSGEYLNVDMDLAASVLRVVDPFIDFADFDGDGDGVTDVALLYPRSIGSCQRMMTPTAAVRRFARPDRTPAPFVTEDVTATGSRS